MEIRRFLGVTGYRHNLWVFDLSDIGIIFVGYNKKTHAKTTI